MTCTYLFKDPKTNVWRYVGKGVDVRPYRHFHPNCDTQLSRMLKKRRAEGFDPQPVIIHAENDVDAIEMEMLLIAMIGREDLQTGPLFNKTNGGEGCAGRKVEQAEIQKRAGTFSNWTDTEKKYFSERVSEGRTGWMNRRSAEFKTEFSKKIAKAQERPCTLDGKVIYPSRDALIKACGQGSKTGSRSPNFRYVDGY